MPVSTVLWREEVPGVQEGEGCGTGEESPPRERTAEERGECVAVWLAETAHSLTSLDSSERGYRNNIRI